MEVLSSEPMENQKNHPRKPCRSACYTSLEAVSSAFAGLMLVQDVGSKCTKSQQLVSKVRTFSHQSRTSHPGCVAWRTSGPSFQTCFTHPSSRRMSCRTASVAFPFPFPLPFLGKEFECWLIKISNDTSYALVVSFQGSPLALFFSADETVLLQDPGS